MLCYLMLQQCSTFTVSARVVHTQFWTPPSSKNALRINLTFGLKDVKCFLFFFISPFCLSALGCTEPLSIVSIYSCPCTQCSVNLSQSPNVWVICHPWPSSWFLILCSNSRYCFIFLASSALSFIHACVNHFKCFTSSNSIRGFTPKIGLIVSFLMSVSYTHLDVYKRQVLVTRYNNLIVSK